MAKLYFYYSAMNAGKSTTLLQAAHNYHERGMRTLVYAPAIDDRHGLGQITSRIGLSSPAIVLPSDADLYEDVRTRHREKAVHCVLIDEAQFLTARQVLQATKVCDLIGIPVLCYGIRTDFQGEPFEGSKYLLSWAEEISEIKTVCQSGRKATMNARLDAQGNRVWQGQQVDVGHHYIAMSRKEFQLERVSPVAQRPS
jgi:thymidine kinase